MSVGPQIPEHLLSKYQIRDQEDAEKDALIGPQLPSSLIETEGKVSTPQSNSNVLQEKPTEPLLSSSSTLEHTVEEDDPDAYLPALPPDLLEERQKNKQRAGNDKAIRSKGPIIGPAMPPPGYLADQKEDEEDEEDMVGPVLPKGFIPYAYEDEVDDKVAEIEERAARMRKQLDLDNTSAQDKPLERGEWMLVPPEARFLDGSTTNMKSRQFKKISRDPSQDNNSLWTETPAEREKRITDQSKKSLKRQRPIADEEPSYSQRDLDIAQQVHEYNAEYRGKSLLDSHTEEYLKSRKWQKEDVSKRPFDRDRDVLGSRRMDAKKRAKIMEEAKGMDSKFTHGRSGAFL
ncbi:9506_t:CDS:2 [Paraglomus occultum]|uniref:9506_t:CDS:1 n=1 Tax=Paraglomus occultum TaxID=144539 RepID=A0A9N9CDB0_9GLOM|nr:9506_t:CDS:2 [Paraglomus occultum]